LLTFIKVFFLFTLIILTNCKKDYVEISEFEDDRIVDNNVKYNFVKTPDGRIFASLDPMLIRVIKKRMVEAGREKDTIKLNNTYDQITGDLLIEVDDNLFEAKQESEYEKICIDSSNMVFNYDTIPYKENTTKRDPVFQGVDLIEAHCQSYGWMGYVEWGEWAGTRGEAKRLEAFHLSTNTMFNYTCRVEGSIWWQSMKMPDMDAGTTGKHKAVVKLKFCVPLLYPYAIEYWIHEQSYGDLGPFYDCTIAGHNDKRIEAIKIYVYEY